MSFLVEKYAKNWDAWREITKVATGGEEARCLWQLVLCPQQL